MKASDIKVGGLYKATVNGRLVTVKVTDIRPSAVTKRPIYDVVSQVTGRKTTFRSALKFLEPASPFASTAKTPAKIPTIQPASTTADTAAEPSPGDSEQPTTPLEPPGYRGDHDEGEVKELTRPFVDPPVKKAGGWYNKIQPATPIQAPAKFTTAAPTIAQSTVKGTSATGSRQEPVQNVVVATPARTNEDENSSDPIPSAFSSMRLHGTQKHDSPLTTLLKRSLAAVSDTSPHLIIEARAGTGKTTTLIEGLKRVKGLPTTLVPSPQQAKIWEQMELSKGKVNSICFVAFNNSIAAELSKRVPKGCDAMTIHSMGYRAVIKGLGYCKPINDRVKPILQKILGIEDEKELWKKKAATILATRSLVKLCKMTLASFDSCGNELKDGDPDWTEVLSKLASHYDVELNGNREEVFCLVPKVLEMCKEVRGFIDYADMIWLPIVHNLPLPSYDMLLVDEAQDLNRCQQALVKRVGKRLILCGDPKQAIYGFAGADSESMARMGRELGIGDPMQTPGWDGAVGRGCLTLPLTVTRRCAKAIVREAQRYVPDFEAFETNPEGTISEADCPEYKMTSGQLTGGKPQPREMRPGETNYREQAKPGDMILCRCNAPLVNQCFRFLKEGKPAMIRGRDIGDSLVELVKSRKAYTTPELVKAVSDWAQIETENEQARPNPSEDRLTNIQDRMECIFAFAEGTKFVFEVLGKIEAVFSDNLGDVIKLSSVHKAKGLEAKRVFILQVEKAVMPKPAKSSWQTEQECNLYYVAVTRAIEELTFVY